MEAKGLSTGRHPPAARPRIDLHGERILGLSWRAQPRTITGDSSTTARPQKVFIEGASSDLYEGPTLGRSWMTRPRKDVHRQTPTEDVSLISMKGSPSNVHGGT